MFRRHRNPDSGPNYAKENVAEALTIATEYAINEKFLSCLGSRVSCCHLVVKWKFQSQSNCSKMGVQTFCAVRPGLAVQPRLALLPSCPCTRVLGIQVWATTQVSLKIVIISARKKCRRYFCICRSRPISNLKGLNEMCLWILVTSSAFEIIAGIYYLATQFVCLYSFPCLAIRVEIEDIQDRGNSYISVSTQNSTHW